MSADGTVASTPLAPVVPQNVASPLSRAAVFVVLAVTDAPDAPARVRSALGDVSALVRAVGFRDLSAQLSCVASIGARVWTAVTATTPPSQLRAFTPVVGAVHTAPATEGDLLLHIRADRTDMCFELERLLLDALGDAVRVVDETSGFRYFESRDLLGFVDGTENPTGSAIVTSALVGTEDEEHRGGSYVVTQKYLHDLAAWTSLPTEVQERIIGRSKADNVELDDATIGERKSHKDLATIVDSDGVEHDIVRDNMPFGRPGHGEFGTYFIGYSRDLWVTEQMLSNMFIGSPIGSYDRMLDVSTPVTGTVFFAPSQDELDSFGD